MRVWRNGSRGGFKPHWERSRAGSIPVTRTKINCGDVVVDTSFDVPVDETPIEEDGVKALVRLVAKSSKRE